MISRRLFIKTTGSAVLAYGALPVFLRQTLWAAQTTAPSSAVLVFIIQRGAMDGLSAIPPIGDPRYFEARPNIAIQKQGDRAAISLDGHFGLHPSLEPLKPFWDDKTFALIHQVGSPDPSRSHFDAQDFLEIGEPGEKNLPDGFLNRAMQILPGSQTPLRAVALQPSMPRILQGAFPAVSMNSIHEFNLSGGGSANKNEVEGFEAMYQQAADKVFRGVGNEIFDSLKAVHSLDGDKGKHKDDDGYPKAAIGKRLREIAALIKGGIGLQIAVTDVGGWDTHVNQGNEKGQLSDRLSELAQALAAFRKDLGPKFNDVCVITQTEFGRTVKENGNRGTDHGHGSVMMALGGKIRGGKVYGKWKDLSSANLYEGRDLPVTTDSRDVVGEILSRHLGISDLARIFPKYENDRAQWLGLMRG